MQKMGVKGSVLLGMSIDLLESLLEMGNDWFMFARVDP